MNPNYKLKTEDKLLILCARNHIGSTWTEKINELINHGLNWDYLVKQASDHSLGSLLYFQLSKTCPEKVPRYIMDQLYDHHNHNVRRNLLMMGQLLKILKLLDSEGIKVLPYKGPVLADKIYGNISLREFGDLDIYVDKKDVLRIKEILNSAGYEPKLKFTKERELQYLKVQREYQFIHQDSKVSVEIQWNLVDLSLSFPAEPAFTMDQIGRESTIIKNTEISVFSDEDLLIILSLHTVTHLWGKLSWICDIAGLVKSSENLNWDKIIEKSQLLAVERILYLNLALVIELFDIKLPDKVRNRIDSDHKIQILKQDVIRIIFDSENYGFIRRFFLRFKIREKNWNKIKDFIKLLVIPTSTEWELFQQSLPLKLLYILFRPIQIFNKAIKISL